MNHFLSPVRRSAKRKIFLILIGMIYLGYVGIALYCQCLEGTAHQSEHQAQAEAVADHSHEQSPKSHPCDCVEVQNFLLTSLSTPTLAKLEYIAGFAVTPFSMNNALSVPSPFRLIATNLHGPPSPVSLHIRNQVFLI